MTNLLAIKPLTFTIYTPHDGSVNTCRCPLAEAISLPEMSYMPILLAL